MYNINEKYKQVLKSNEQQYDAYIILEDGTKVDSDISGLKPIFNLGEKIIGNFVAKRVEFTLFNTSKYNITNKEFEVFIGIKIDNEFNYTSLGKFIANKPEIKDEAQDECSIVAQNYSLKFKVQYEPILIFPCTIKEAIKRICEHLNIVYVENDFINSNYVLEEFFIDEDATFFDVIKILVEAGFANADINNSNSLIVKSPSKTINYTFSLNELFELKKEDNKFGPINSIVASRIVADDGSTTEDVFVRNEISITKNGLYEYKIKQNDAIDYDRQTAVNNILNGILDFEYIPATIETVYNPAAEVGDIFEVPDVKADTSFLLFAKEISADLSTGLMTIESTEETQTQTDYKSATNKDKRRKTEAKINKLEGEITLLNQKTETNTQQIKESITTVEVMYALSDSTLEAPTSGWSTVAPEWTNGKYMWQKTVTIQADGTSVESEPTCISGATGQQGSDGKSSYLHIKYSDDGITFTTPSSIVSNNVEDWESGQYSWEDGTKQNATDRIRLKELVSVELLATYVFNTNNNDSQFVIRAYDKDKKYLTSIGGITNGSSKTIPSNICYIGVSISSPNYEHVITTDWISDGRIIPTICKSSDYIYGENIGKYRGELVDNNPTASTTFLDYKWVKIEGEAGKDGTSGTDGKSAYEIWLENGNTGTEEDYLASLKGDTGAQGEIGVGVNEIIPQYYLSTSDTQQVDGEWGETQPQWTEGTYIWTRSKVIYTDESIKYTTPVLAEAMNQTLKNTTEINEKYTEMKTTTESITNTVSDIKEVTNNIDGSIVEIEKSIDTLEQTINGLENTLETQGGSNLLLNSSGLFDNEHWEGNVKALTSTDIQNNFIAKACFNLQNGSMKQTIEVVNGTYYIGFKYQKLLELASCKVLINGIEIELTETNLTEVNNYIEVSEHGITIELVSDTDNACLIGDIIIVKGSKQSWSSNMNEIYTSTVKIGIGLEIVSNTMKTKLLANADGVRIVNTINNKVTSEFTDKGMKTDELEANTAKIARILIQDINKQTWISRY